MTQLPYSAALGAPTGATSYPPRAPSPGPERKQSMPLPPQGVGAANAPGSSFPLGGGSLGRSATMGAGAGTYTTNAMSSRIAQQPSPAGHTLPSQPSSGAPFSRPLPQPTPQPSPQSTPQPHSQIYSNQSYSYQQPLHNPVPAATPLQQHPQPAPNDPRAAHAAALAAHHASLVAYYWHYAQQGLVAPVEAGNEMQLRAREEAVSWARGQGIVVVDPSQPVAPVVAAVQPPTSTRPTPAFPPQRQSTAPAAVAYPQATPQPAQPPASLPFAPSSSSHVPSPIPPNGGSLPTPPSTAPATPSGGRPLPSPTPTPPTGRPLPTVPAGSAVAERRPLPSPIPNSPSGLLRSASLANSPSSPVSPDSPSSLHRAASTSVVASSWSPSPASLPSAAPAASPSPSLVGVGPSESKRPLPTPPGAGGAAGAGRPLPGIGKTPEALLQEKMASISVQEAPSPPARAPSPKPTPPAVPSMSFSGPDEQDSAPRPLSPSFAFTLADEDGAPSSKPAVPTFSTSAPTPSFSLPDSHPLPTPPTTYASPRLHPRFDPNHPSHYLYHPTSTAPSPTADSPVPTGVRLEAGAIACAGCGQQMYGRALMAMGREWHPDCFRCAEQGCGLLLEHVQFDGREGEGVYCMVHFEEHYAEKCFHCKTPIADSEYINISDPLLLPPTPIRTYHATHFFCANCGDPFVDPSSLAKGKEHTLAKPYLVHKGYAYCEGCDLRMYKPKCVRCKKGIAADWIEAGEQKYHMECFKCVDCDKLLSGHYLMRDEGPANGGEQSYCGACFDIRAKNE